MSVVQGLSELAEKISQHEISRIEAVLEGLKTSEDIDRLILAHSLTQAEAARVCGLSINTFRERVAEAIELGIIPAVLYDNKKYRFTLKHMHAIMDWLGIETWASLNKEPIVINTQNNKGGTGKSTTVTSIAAGVALQLKQRRRVLVIDLDPQGSQRVIAAPDMTDDQRFLSAVDVMLGEFEEGSHYQQLIAEGHSHEEILLSTVLGTHIPNFDIIPAFPTDERFSSAAWFDFAEKGELTFLRLLKEKVIEPLKAHYDFIMIDTGPHSNPLTWAALEACNALFIPVSPRKLDWVSTGQYINGLPQIFSQLPSKGENIKYLKVMAVNFDEEQGRDFEILEHMKDVLGRYLINAQLKRSSAFEAASRNYRTIHDLRKGDNLCPDRQLDKAISSMNDVVRELLLTLKDVDWSSR
jgi:cellulose biosynthesis protein BcsQ